MGIKAIKEKYNILHMISREGNNYHIGSPYQHDIITFNSEGKIIKRYKNREYNDGWSTNEDLKRYQEEMYANPTELKRLIELKDEIVNPIPVFTYEGSRVVKKWCEIYGWPEITTDGEIMYDNTFFRTYKEAYNALLVNTNLKYDFKTFHQIFGDGIRKVGKAFKYLSRAIYRYIYSRTIQRVVGLFKN